MKTSLKITLITLCTFGFYFILDELYFKVLRKWFIELTNHFGLSHTITYLISGIPIFLGTYLINRKTSIIESLGLRGSFIKGLLFSFICTLPIFIGFSLVFEMNHELSMHTLLVTVVSAGLFEELYFRGFLFGQLFKYTRLGFIPSVFLGALFFGLIHLYQSTDLTELILIFLITFLGGILFAWAYAEWHFNIWIPVFLHLLMNFAWELFSVSDTAIGDKYSNIFRFISIGLIIALTILYKRSRGMTLAISKKTLWIKPKANN
ncbi:CPBP family intramembrane glutamic endopeptidase [Geojedonia litorea]|uniref:CPBP family intramembrane glutamic endopeptidase n=1 Tax=Geojedonia litorea TaxID=1268269 RepID=A0ABV9MYB7_9FLAO